jgi:hypothetical protein
MGVDLMAIEQKVVKEFTKHEMAILAHKLKQTGMLPVDGLRIYYDESPSVELNKIDFVKGDKQLTVGLISKTGEFDTSYMQKQLEKYFLEGKK